jgi:hypothetical protein
VVAPGPLPSEAVPTMLDSPERLPALEPPRTVVLFVPDVRNLRYPEPTVQKTAWVSETRSFQGEVHHVPPSDAWTDLPGRRKHVYRTRRHNAMALLGRQQNIP